MIDIDKNLQEIFSDADRRRAWVVYRVKLRGLSLAHLARQAGVSRSCLYQVFRKPYPRMEQIVANAVGLTPQILFPERYSADGLPIQRRGRPKKYTQDNTSDKKQRNVKKCAVV